MTDSVAVFPPGYRLTDNSTGAPLSGAVIRFFDAGTTNPKTVYSDGNLTTSLGTTVTTDSLGYPTSDGTARTMIYVGTEAYKIEIETSGGVTIASHDNVKGAVEIVDVGDLSVTSTRPVLTKSLNYTVLAADQNTYFRSNCSGGDVTFTLPSAATVGDGWLVTVQHAGSANETFIATVSSQTLSDGALSYGTSMVLTHQGEEVTLVSDGGNWNVFSHTVALFKTGSLNLLVADRLSTPPGSPAAGSLYILTSSPTGAWSSFAEHDVVFYTGAAWVRIAPGEGWTAWVADEDLRYTFTGSTWQAARATTALSGIVELATNAETVTATDTARVAPLSAMRYHPGIAKALGYVTYSSGTPTLQSGSVNITSITDTSLGVLTVTIADDFADTNYATLVTCNANNTEQRSPAVLHSTKAVGSLQVSVTFDSGNRDDPNAISIACFGTLA